MKANKKGFSTVELLIVVAVAGLLGAAGWLVYNNQQKSKNNAIDVCATKSCIIKQIENDRPNVYAQTNTYLDNLKAGDGTTLSRSEQDVCLSRDEQAGEAPFFEHKIFRECEYIQIRYIGYRSKQSAESAGRSMATNAAPEHDKKYGPTNLYYENPTDTSNCLKNYEMTTDLRHHVTLSIVVQKLPVSSSCNLPEVYGPDATNNLEATSGKGKPRTYSINKPIDTQQLVAGAQQNGYTHLLAIKLHTEIGRYQTDD